MRLPIYVSERTNANRGARWFDVYFRLGRYNRVFACIARVVTYRKYICIVHGRTTGFELDLPGGFHIELTRRREASAEETFASLPTLEDVSA